MRFEVSEERKFAIVAEVKERLAAAGATVSDVDGARVTSDDGWWLLRASNTQNVLVARCESQSEAGLERLKSELAAQLGASGVDLRSEEHTSELQSLMRNSYAVFCLKKKKKQ